MTGIERLRELSGELHSAPLSEIADQIEREHAQTCEDHERQQGIIRDLQSERDEALRELKKCKNDLRSAYSATIAASSDYADLQGEIFTMCEAFGVELEKGDRGDVAEQKLIAKVYEIIREKDEALRAAATCRKVASELRTLAGEWDEYGLGGPLMTLAERLEAHEAAAACSTEVTSKTYTRYELGERNASCDDHASEPGATFGGEKVTRDASIAVPVLAVVEEMERHCLGVEGMEDSPVARWAWELRRACEGVEVPADVETVKTEALDALKWVREHGGLEEVKGRDWFASECAIRITVNDDGEDDGGRLLEELDRRLMPEGMEWPRFEDGEKVKFGDDISGVRVESVVFRPSGVLMSDCTSVPGWGTWRTYKEPIKRPKPAPVGLDGLPIKKGDSVLAKVGGKLVEFTVLDIDPERFCGNGYILCGYVDKLESHLFAPHQLTHTKPEIDTWQRIEEDAGCTATKYNERRGTIFTTKQQVARDLVRRCKALAELERSE